MRNLLLCMGIVLLLSSVFLHAAQQESDADASEPFIIGADISWVQQQEDQGKKFKDNGLEKDILEILKDHGFNYIRLRIFHNPKAPRGYSREGYCDLPHTLEMAKRIKSAGMKSLLDFHYSDTWADPGKQFKPIAWRDLDFDELVKAVEDYTKDVVTAFKKQGTPPDMIQIGNEISSGFIWPDGRLDDWDKFATLFKAGVKGAGDAYPKAKIMLHLACGGQNEKSRNIIDNLLSRGVSFDILGQSYYPKWHGTLDDLKSNLNDLAKRYERDLIVVEYSKCKREVNEIVRDLPKGRGLGTFIWEPTRWDEPLFDRDGNTLPAIDLYKQFVE